MNNYDNSTFFKEFLNALLHFLLSIIYFLFGIPFSLWCKAMKRIAVQRNEGALRIGNINSPWPFLSFLKIFLLEFLFDAVAFIAYPLGLVVGLVMMVYTWIEWHVFWEGVMACLSAWISAYYMPVTCSWMRDACQFLIVMPLRKLVSWLYKPAQHLDLDIKDRK